VEIISWFTSIVYKTFFLSGDTGFRRAHWAVKIAHVAIVALIIAIGDTRLLVELSLISMILGLYSLGYEWVVSTLALSAILSVYMSLTALIASLIGIAPISLERALLIAIRTLALSTTLAFTFTIISPLEITSLLIKLGARRASATPLLTWRLIPYGLKSFIESLQVGYVKGERTLSRIPPAVASIVEAGRLIEEYCFYKLSSKAKLPILPHYDYKYSIILLVCDAVTVISVLILLSV